MCGFIFYQGKNFSDKASIKYSLMLMKHRGPDNTKIIIEKKNKVSIGFVRLSIVDLSSKSNQPLSYENKRYYIVFNGEIYNFEKLKKELKEKKIKFKSNGDCEVLLQSFLFWREKVFSKIRGMYSFIIYDKKLNTKFVARDELGIKPLYYHNSNNGLIISSDLKSILPFMKKIQINKKAFNLLIFASHVPPPLSIINKVQKLKPGHYLKINSKNQIKSFRFWKPKIEEKNLSKKYLKKKFNDNIKTYSTLSERKTGLLLSSGFDSNAILNVMLKNKKKNLSVLTLGSKNKINDESKKVRKICKIVNVKPKIDNLENYKLFNLTKTIYRKIDEPILFSSTIFLYILFNICKKNKITVALSGTGGDEISGGYNWSEIKLINLNSYILKIIKKTFLIIGKVIKVKKIHNLINNLENKNTIIQRYLNNCKLFEPTEFIKLTRFKKDFKLNEVNNFFSFFLKKKNIKIKRRILLSDISHYLSNINLQILDKVSMLNSVEARVPYLDIDFLEAIISSKNFTLDPKKKIIKEFMSDSKLYKTIKNFPKKGGRVDFSKNKVLQRKIDIYLKENIFVLNKFFVINDIEKSNLSFNQKFKIFGFINWYNNLAQEFPLEK